MTSDIAKAAVNFCSLGEGEMAPYLEDIGAALKRDGFQDVVSYESVYRPDGATDFEIRNNIFSIRGDRSFITMDRSSKPGALIDADCFHNRAGRARGLGAHSTVGDPRFLNPANNDSLHKPSSLTVRIEKVLPLPGDRG